jgi:crotonobetainyl-CoA:carnitine CoA-transferase CaiB-like acyl-CoA transferase
VVDSAIYEAVLAVMESTVPEYTEGGEIRERSGAILPKIAPSNVYPTADDDSIVMGANQDSVFTRLAEAMGDPSLAEHPDYADHVSRGEHQAELDELIGRWTVTLDADALLQQLEAHGVPAGRIYRVPEMLEDPHFQARESIVDVEHPAFKNLKMQNIFPKLSRSQGKIRWPGPELGAHNNEIYGGLLEISGEALQDLIDDGVV